MENNIEEFDSSDSNSDNLVEFKDDNNILKDYKNQETEENKKIII